MTLPSAPGATVLASLTGAEFVPVINAGPQSAVCTTQQIAALASLESSSNVLTTISTVGAGSLTAAALVGGNISRTGIQVAAFTDTTVSAATIIAALPAGAAIGTSFKTTYTNNQTGAAGYVATIAGGSGVTVSGITKVPTGSSATYLLTYTAANTITMVGVSSGLANTTQLDLTGSTSGQTTLLPAAISAASVLTLPAATDTLVGRATTDTLTNKTLTAPILTGGVFAQTSGANLAVIDIYRTSAPVTKNANVTPATVTGLSGAIVVGTYRFRAVLPSTVASGTGGIAYSFLLTTAVLSAMEATGLGYTASAVAVQHTTTATSGTALFTQAAVVIMTIVEGTFVVSTGGTFAIQMCQNTSNASDTIALLGGSLELTRIA